MPGWQDDIDGAMEISGERRRCGGVEGIVKVEDGTNLAEESAQDSEMTSIVQQRIVVREESVEVLRC